MDEVKLKNIHFNITKPEAWESFLSDVLDLPVAPTDSGLEFTCSGITFYLHPAASSDMIWEFSLPEEEREIILSRWSFYQYRMNGEIALRSSNASLIFQIDAQSKVVVGFESSALTRSLESDSQAVRNF